MSEKKKGAENSTNDLATNQTEDKKEFSTLTEIEQNIDEIIIEDSQKALNQLESILLSLPSELQEFINENFKHKRIPKGFMFSSILFAYSNASGLAFYTHVLNYTNYANLYFAIISDRGDTKSEPMNIATLPLKKYDDRSYYDFRSDTQKLRESVNNDSNLEVKRKQLLLQNATIESAIYSHYNNPYSIGIYIDELMGLIAKMADNNSNQGAEWRVFFLQGNTNSHIDISRKTTDSFRIEQSYPTLLGAIQTEFIPKLFSNGNLESGFIDRILFTNKLTKNTLLSGENLNPIVYENYKLGLINLLDQRFRLERASEKERIVYSNEAEKELMIYAQDLILRKEKLPKILKAYTSKMEINIHKMILLIHLIKNAKTSTFNNPINKQTVKLSILIIEFYYTNFKLTLEQKPDKINENEFRKELITRASKNNVNNAQTVITSILKISKGQVSKLFKKYLSPDETGN
ncbi:DUF3987 domain-containing protein [Winogradskyella tangerina]|uniref:DUF3987 domain-containing protein n=1 Tax=Winogradskyella tangerina TaxID=2023240 RepID=UPI000DBE2CE5|nr:DUF3987 domain-containing protein [Winogradskyella tangerina]